MQQTRILAIAFLLFLGQTSLAAEMPFVRFSQTMGERSVLRCGVVLSEDSTSIRFFDLKNQTEESIDKSSVRAMKSPLTEQEATTLIGAVPVTGWSISQALPSKSKPGLIADVDGREAYLNIGKESQLQVGQQMIVRRAGEEITDPETGEILGKRQQWIAEVLVTEIQERLTKVRIVGNPESDLKIGDSVHFQGAESAVAVLPLSVEAGSDEDSGKRFASELTTYLSKNGVELVERTKLDDVIRELALVDTGLVNPEAIQKIGRLAEAFAVVTGEVQPFKKFDTYNVRLVEVSTGKILYSTSLQMKRTENGSIEKTKGRDKGWVNLFKNERSEDDPSGVKIRKLIFHGPGGDRNVIGRYESSTDFILQDGSLQPRNGEQAILAVGNGKDFEMESQIVADGTGGWFVLIGWTGERGYLLYNVSLRQSGFWRIEEVGLNKFVGHTQALEDYRPKGSQEIRIAVVQQRLFFSIGEKVLADGVLLPEYNGGEIIIGTASTQYGTKRIKIESLRIRPID